MAHPMGESKAEVPRFDFESRLELVFHGSKVTSDAGLAPYREPDDAVGLTEIVGDVLTDTRRGKNGRHGLVGQFRQSVFGHNRVTSDCSPPSVDYPVYGGRLPDTNSQATKPPPSIGVV